MSSRLECWDLMTVLLQSPSWWANVVETGTPCCRVLPIYPVCLSDIFPLAVGSNIDVVLLRDMREKVL